MIRRFEKFTFAISGMQRCLHRIMADEMERYGLKGPHALYLIALKQRPQGITAAQLCDLCERDKADISRAVSTLETKGLILREGKNPYRALLKLTEQGQVAAAALCQKASTAVELAGRGLTDEKRATFYEALELIATNLQAISQKGIPQP